MGAQDFERNTINSGQILHFLCPENTTFPNNSKLELCILKQTFSLTLMIW